MPTVVANPAIAVVGSNAYIIGGYLPSDNTLQNDVIAYDFETGIWTTTGFTPIPTPRVFGYAAPVIDGKIYLIGGDAGNLASHWPTDVVEIYDPATDAWSTGPPLPQATGSFLPVLLDRTIYVIGGVTAYSAAGNTRTGAVWSYNPDNARLNGTYGYISRYSGFLGAGPLGGIGKVDQEWVEYGDFAFDGAGGCTLSKTSGDDILRTIGETGTFSNTFTTTHFPGPPNIEPCTYSVAGDGTLTFNSGSVSADGIVSADGNTVLFGGAEAVPGDFFGTSIVLAVKKGTGLSNASLNGTYAVAGKWSLFEGADTNGGFGVYDEEGVARSEITFNGIGGCTDSTISEDIVRRSIGETGISNTFTTIHSSPSPSAEACTYSVAGDGTLTISSPGEIDTGVVSADGSTLILSGKDAIPGVGYGTWASVSVKKPTGFNNASVSGIYSWVTKASGFIDSDINGGFGMTDIERVDKSVAIFDGAGGCALSDSPEELINRTIGETGAFSNTFTTVHIPGVISSKSCIYDVAPDGTMTMTLAQGEPGEFTLTVAIREDGNFGFFTGVSTDPSWMEVALAMVVKMPVAGGMVNFADYWPLALGNYWTYQNAANPADTFTNSVFEQFTFAGNPAFKFGSDTSNYQIIYNDGASVTLYAGVWGGIAEDPPDVSTGMIVDGACIVTFIDTYDCLRLWDNLDPAQKSVYGIDPALSNLVLMVSYDKAFPPNAQNNIAESNLGLSLPYAVTHLQWLQSGVGIIASIDVAASTGVTGPRYDLIHHFLFPRAGTFATDDFDGDGRSDILWRNTASGLNYLYVMNAELIASQGTIDVVSGSDWQIVGTGDYDGNKTADILWRNGATGENKIYFMNGNAIVSQGSILTIGDTDWQVAGSGDYNGDGKSDILWRRTGDGRNHAYLMNDNLIASQGTINTVPLNWLIAGTGDYNGDGKADILWRNTSNGRAHMYFLNGFTIVSQGTVGTVPLEWEIKGDGDYNGDGKADILWRNMTPGDGRNYMYFMNGNVIASSGYVNAVSNFDFVIVNVR